MLKVPSPLFTAPSPKVSVRDSATNGVSGSETVNVPERFSEVLSAPSAPSVIVAAVGSEISGASLTLATFTV